MKKIAWYLLWAVLLVFLVIARIQVNDLREQNSDMSKELFHTQVLISRYAHGLEYLELIEPKVHYRVMEYISTETE
jgi:hypothetical protein